MPFRFRERVSQSLGKPFVQHGKITSAAYLTLGSKKPRTHLFVVVVRERTASPQTIPGGLRNQAPSDRAGKNEPREAEGLAPPVSTRRRNAGQQLDANDVQVGLDYLGVKNMD